MQQQLEYVWCMDTMNRVKKPGDNLLPNPTNDVTVKPQLSVNRMLVNSIELATLELPRVQRLIEPEWSRIYTYDGFPIQPGENTLVIKCEGNHEYTAALPVTFNTLMPVGTAPYGANIEFEAKDDHLLEQSMPIWADASQTIQLVGLESTSGAPPEFTLTTGDEKKFTTSYNTNWAVDFKVATLYHPPLPSPEFVAIAVTNSLNKKFQLEPGAGSINAFKVTFDTAKSRYAIQIYSNIVTMFPYLKSARLESGGLISALGFTAGVLLFNQSNLDCAIVASNLPYGTKYVQLDAGDYKSSQLAAEIQRASNSTYLPPSATPYKLSIGIDGDIKTITVPSGMYTPVTLAATITSLCASSLPVINIQLVWHATDAVYIFRSTDGFIFSLEFTPELTNIANQLGFSPFRYSCAAEYESKIYTNPQQISGSPAYGTTICQVEDDVSAQKITFYLSRPSPALGQGASYSNNVLTMTSTTAHGFQIGDVVQYTLASGETYPLRVTVVSNGLSFSAACPFLTTGTGSIAQFPTGPTTSVFLSLNNEYALKPGIIGFGQYDLMWAGQSTIRSPFTYRLQASTYVLLEMVHPYGNARIEHRNGGDNRTTILGKIVTLKDPFLDRFYPMKASFFTGVRLDYCQFRLLNPDHSLYKLHGHDWQATFRLYAVDLPLE